jgi:ribosomal protein L14E/L6E/L27E
MDKSTPITLPTQNVNIDRKDIKFIGEHKLTLDNKNYVIKFGKIENKIEELIIFAKDENLIDTCYYQRCFSIENLQKVNKVFRQYDTIDESIDALKDIISHKKISIKKENNELHIILKYLKLGKGEEEIIFILKKNNIESGKIIENLISNIDNLKLEIEKLKKEISEKKLIKYHPVLENGWIVDPNIVQELKVKGDIKRQELSLTNVTLTEDKVDIEKGAKKEEVLKAIEEYKIENKYKKSNFGKKVEIRQKRANLTDFDRFKVMSYKIKTK